MPAISNSTAIAALILSAIRLPCLGRPRGNRTPNLRFWRPTLCQLSYWPVVRLALTHLTYSASFDHFGDDACADGLAALADREAQALLHRDGRDQRHHHLHVVPGHHHLGALRELHRPRHIGRPEVKLRPVVVEERRMPPALFFGEHVHLALELRVRGDRAGLRQHLATLDLFSFRASQENADVVPRLALVQDLPDHLHARAHRLLRGLDPHDLDLLPHLDHPALDAPGDHRPPSRDGEHILHRHQKG